MFDLGPEKILVVLVFALVMFGPNELPRIARTVGDALRTVRGVQDQIREELSAVVDSPAESGVAPVVDVEASPARIGAVDDPAQGASFI